MTPVSDNHRDMIDSPAPINALTLFDEALCGARRKRLEQLRLKRYLRARRAYLRHLEHCDDCLLGGALRDAAVFCAPGEGSRAELLRTGRALAACVAEE